MTTLHEINQKAQAALRSALGPVDYARYQQQFSTGAGDYTAERQQAGQPAIEEIFRRVADLADKGQLNPPPAAGIMGDAR
jgi:hypothetical protein